MNAFTYKCFPEQSPSLSSSLHSLFLEVMIAHPFFFPGRKIYYPVIVQLHSYLLLVKWLLKEYKDFSITCS